MLLEHLYKISLERPEYWAMWIGLPPSCHKMLDIRIELLGSYINGFRVSRELSNQDEIESDHFFRWLIDEKHEFPTKGWITKYLEDCEGDHYEAIQKFWKLLHEYLLVNKPKWFIELNAQPLASEIQNGLNERASKDLRNPDHIKASTQ